MSNSHLHKRGFLRALTQAAQGKTSLDAFLVDVLTRAEYEDIVFRWRILALLHAGVTQRAIAQELRVSIAKVTRGSRVLQKPSRKGVREILALHPLTDKEKSNG